MAGVERVAGVESAGSVFGVVSRESTPFAIVPSGDEKTCFANCNDEKTCFANPGTLSSQGFGGLPPPTISFQGIERRPTLRRALCGALCPLRLWGEPLDPSQPPIPANPPGSPATTFQSKHQHLGRRRPDS